MANSSNNNCNNGLILKKKETICVVIPVPVKQTERPWGSGSIVYSFADFFSSSTYLLIWSQQSLLTIYLAIHHYHHVSIVALIS